MQPVLVEDLVLPTLLVELVDSGRWKQPSDSVIEAKIPILDGPIDFLLELEAIRENSPVTAAVRLREVDDPIFLEMLKEENDDVKVSFQRHEKPDLPWLDATLAVCLAENRHHGDDLMLALDYRKTMDSPRVVANERTPDEMWREVFSSFEELAVALELV